MNNGYGNFNNYPNNNYPNNMNSMQNNNLNNEDNNNNNDKTKILNIGLVIMLVVGISFIFFAMHENNTGDRNLEESYESNQVDNEIQQPSEETESEETPSVEENEQQPEVEEEQTQQSTTSTNVTMKCTKTVNNEYGKFVYTNTYKFKNDNLTTGEVKLKATLKSSYRNYRDSLISQLKSENKKYVKLKGISESVSKHSDGFTYTLKLNASKLSSQELADMGYRTRNRSGVRMYAYNNGFSCK